MNNINQEDRMIQEKLPAHWTVRQGTRADIPFLAWCNYEASSPAPGFCYWDPLLAETGTPTLAFIEALFAADALAWGHCEEFLILEERGRPLGGASGFEMNPNDYRPLRLDRLPAVARRLGWTDTTLAGFRQGYEAVWSDPQDPTLAPLAPWTIECVAVVPEARGRGVARALLRTLLERGRAAGHAAAGIAVTLGNEPARRVYEALGFEIYVTYGAAYFDGAFAGTIKYRLGLSGS
jgi:ribosomal protein S18 acetylase RimI-like enzyme